MMERKGEVCYYCYCYFNMILKAVVIITMANGDIKAIAEWTNSHRPPTGKRGQGGKKKHTHTHTKTRKLTH